MDLTPLIKPESSTWWSFPTLDNFSDQFPMVRWSDLENIFENTLTFYHNFLEVVNPILSFLFLSAWLFKFLFFRSVREGRPVHLWVNQKLVWGWRPPLHRSERPRSEESVGNFKLKGLKFWQLLGLRGQYFNQEILCIPSLYLSSRKPTSHENRRA